MGKLAILFLLAVQLGAASSISATPGATKDPAPKLLEAIEILHLKPGVNLIPDFGPAGEPVTIVQGWRGNGNAHGYNVWMLSVPESEGNAFGIIGVDYDHAHFLDVVRDDPFTGEQRLGTVYFARAKLGGKPVSLLIDAELDPSPSDAFADHATATIRVLRLEQTDGVPGTTPVAFEPLEVLHTKQRYCNSDYAVRDALGIPLSADAEVDGVHKVDGCY